MTRKIGEIIVRVLTQNDAERIAIFGSYARGEAGAQSDIDILIRFARTKSLLQLSKMTSRLPSIETSLSSRNMRSAPTLPMQYVATKW